MNWFGKHISIMHGAYGCGLNDPMAYMGAHGWRYLRERLKFMWGRHLLKKELNNNQLGNSLVVTERSVEIPLALDFLNSYVQDESVMELGCVLPYYILTPPQHVVYDLVDIHPANIKKDFRDLEIDDYKTNIISISTIEHISNGDYGITQTSVTAINILCRIIENAKRYFVTFPLGHNHVLDEYVFANIEGCAFVTRMKEDKNDWETVQNKAELTELQKSYGGYCHANTVCVVSNCLGA